MKNERGFNTGVTLLIVAIIAVAGIVGWQLWRQKDAPKTAEIATTAIEQPVSAEAGLRKYLTISEWDVRLPLDNTLKNATYTIKTDSPLYGTAAHLSTRELTASDACKAQTDTPTFQRIERLEVSAKTSVNNDETLITAQEATQKDPKRYKLIGSHVYHFAHDSGTPCGGQKGESVYKSYAEAFSGLESTKSSTKPD